jgi:uncharacterized membrane protein
MNALVRATAVGAISGSRSMLGPAVVARRVLPAGAARLMPLLVAGEMLADKSPRIPPRTSFVPLAGRALTGAFAAGAQVRGRQRVLAAAAGAAGAIAAAFALARFRRYAASRGMSNVAAGLIEDAAALWIGALLARTP